MYQMDSTIMKSTCLNWVLHVKRDTIFETANLRHSLFKQKCLGSSNPKRVSFSTIV